MKKAILGKKIGMTQLFRADGTMIPVTVVEAGPCPVVQKKTVAKEGYDAVQVGFCELREKLANKPLKGHCAKAGVKAMRYLRELKLDDAASYEVGQVITCDVFAEGERVDVTGVSKGKGFEGNIKRWKAARPTVPTPTGWPVLWVPAPTPAKSSAPSACPATWAARPSPSRTWRWPAWMPLGTCCSSRAPSPAPRAPWSP